VSAFERGEEELSFEELLGFVGGSDKLTLPCTADKAGNWRRLFGCLGCWQKIWGGGAFTNVGEALVITTIFASVKKQNDRWTRWRCWASRNLNFSSGQPITATDSRDSFPQPLIGRHPPANRRMRAPVR